MDLGLCSQYPMTVFGISLWSLAVRGHGLSETSAVSLALQEVRGLRLVAHASSFSLCWLLTSVVAMNRTRTV